MSQPLKIVVRFILFLLVQALVLNNMPPLHRFITPYLYFLFLLWLPFTKTPGLHASAALLVAYVRPFMINLLVPRETRELKSGNPGIRSMGFASYSVFVLVLVLFHHTWLVLLEWMSFGNFVYFLGKVLMTTLISLLLILITELLFRPIRKRRIE